MSGIKAAFRNRNNDTRESRILETTDPQLRRIVLAKWPQTRTATKVLAKLAKVGVSDLDTLRDALAPPSSQCAVNVSLRSVGARPFGQSTIEELLKLLDAERTHS